MGRYIYAFLRAILGDREGVISYHEIARRSKVSKGRVVNAVKVLEENGYLSKSYIYYRVENALGRKLKLKALCFTPVHLPRWIIFDNQLSPEEKGLLLTLYYLSTPEGKVFYFKAQIIREFFGKDPSSPVLNRAFKSLIDKGYILKERFCYRLVISDNQGIPKERSGVNH
ncbi:hypothetical protein HG1285_15576 [Hydrogenivirga sp. 128-5-R1-1]|nr:hypothetical protein HG1285_15576 [Hydrogenivirga sp. 128-5-R1-1]